MRKICLFVKKAFFVLASRNDLFAITDSCVAETKWQSRLREP
jgi:hypothetical protein